MQKKINFLFICTHPIQNLIPVFVELSSEKKINFTVLYWQKLKKNYFDKEFFQKINFKLNLYNNYNYINLSNTTNTTPVIDIYFQLRVFINTIKVLLFKKFDCILFYEYKFCHCLLIIFCKFLGKKIIIRSVSYNLGKRNIIKNLIRNFYYRFINLFIDEFWSISYLNTQFFMSFGVKSKDIKKINSSQVNYKDLKETINKDIEKLSNKKIILFCGKLINKKNPFLLLKSFQKVKNKKNWVLIFAGNGNLYLKMKKYIEHHRINDVILLGFQNQSQLKYLYRKSEILILPSTFGETHGNVLIESLYFGLALIVSNRVGLYPEIKKKKIGYVFNLNEKNLTNKINLMIKNKKIRKQFQRNALNNWKYWSSQHVAKKILHFLNN